MLSEEELEGIGASIADDDMELTFTEVARRAFALGAERAREDALEAAIVTGGIWVQAAYIAQFNASLRALKTQGDTQ